MDSFLKKPDVCNDEKNEMWEGQGGKEIKTFFYRVRLQRSGFVDEALYEVGYQKTSREPLLSDNKTTFLWGWKFTILCFFDPV